MADAQTETSTYANQIKDVLSREFPRGAVSVKKQNSVAWRVRIVDPRFAGLKTAERDKIVRPLLRLLPEAVQGDITFLLMLAPDEVQDSLMNLEFEHPTRSGL